LTSALNRGKLSASLSFGFAPGKELPTAILQEAGHSGGERKLSLSGMKPSRPVRSYADSAIPTSMSYLRTNKNSIQEKINSKLSSSSACYYSDQNLLSSRLLPKNVKIRK
jgi:hypothetical protein